MSRLASSIAISLLLVSIARVQAQAGGEPPVPPETEAATVKKEKRAAPRTPPQSLPPSAAGTAPPPSAAEVAPPASAREPSPPSAASPSAEGVAPEPVIPYPQPEPAPGEAASYPSEAAPEFGPATTQPSESTPPPSAAASADAASANKPRLIHVAALAGVGVTFDNTIGGVNPLGFGFGLRGDYRFMRDFSFGARVLYFVGGSSVLPTGGVEMESWLLALEGHYILDLDSVLIEPGLLLGIASRSTQGLPAFADQNGGGFVPGSQDSTAIGLYLAPGVNVVVPLSLVSPELDPFFVGGDLRFDLVFGSGVTANLQLLAQIGVQF